MNNSYKLAKPSNGLEQKLKSHEHGKEASKKRNSHLKTTLQINKNCVYCWQYLVLLRFGTCQKCKLLYPFRNLTSNRVEIWRTCGICAQRDMYENVHRVMNNGNKMKNIGQINCRKILKIDMGHQENGRQPPIST